jgi:hypothetical protein
MSSRYDTRCPVCGRWATDGHNCTGILQGDTIRFVEEENGAVVEMRSNRIKTLEDLVEAAEIDLKSWTIERHVVNKWEVGAKDSDGNIVVEPLYQIKVWLKALEPYNEIIEIVQDQIKDMEAHSPEYHAIPRDHSSHVPHLLEVNIADIHFGMLSWPEETGVKWDSGIAFDKFMDALVGLEYKSRHFDINRFLLPLGNDLLHVDNTIMGKGGATNKGTPQDVDTRYPKMFRNARRMCVSAIDYLRQVAPVHVVIIPGNHDKERMFYLGDSVQSWYRNDPETSVDNSAHSRKYIEYGKTLLGFAHGHDEKPASLPMIMATERPEEWSRTSYHEWHIGHQEHRITNGTLAIHTERVL